MSDNNKTVVLIFLLWVGSALAACQLVNPVTAPTSQSTEGLEPVETAVSTPTLLDTPTEEAISALQNQLQANEANTFAGLWLEHEPTFRIIVAFTDDGEETIQQYVVAGSELAQRLEVREAEYTLAQLKADQKAVSHILDTSQQPAGIGIMVMENRVVVDITDQAAFEAALAEANATLPDSVVINTIYEPVGENPPFEITPPTGVFMPQLKQRDAAFMEALLIGELVVEDGCLRVNNDNESTLIIWQADYYLTDNDGLLEILDETGEVVAHVGETIYLGGGEQPALNEVELRQPVPEQCGGPYWRMGQFLPEANKPNAAAHDLAFPYQYEATAVPALNSDSVV